MFVVALCAIVNFKSISIFFRALDEKLFVHDDLIKFNLTFVRLLIPFFLCLGKKRGKSYVSGIYFCNLLDE